MRRALTTSVCLALLGVLPAYGQEERDRVTEKEGRPEVRRVSQLMGARVTIERGEAFGKVTDIVLSEGGCVEYLIVSYEDELVPVPWGVVTYNTGERTLLINVSVTKDRLRDVFFRSGRWPNFHEERWMRNMRSVWGERAFRTEHRDRRDIRDERRDRRENRRDDRATPPRPGDRPPDRNTDRPRDDRTTPPKPGDRPPDRNTDRPRDDRTTPRPDRTPDRPTRPRPSDRPRTPPPDRPDGV